MASGEATISPPQDVPDLFARLLPVGLFALVCLPALPQAQVPRKDFIDRHTVKKGSNGGQSGVFLHFAKLAERELKPPISSVGSDLRTL